MKKNILAKILLPIFGVTAPSIFASSLIVTCLLTEKPTSNEFDIPDSFFQYAYDEQSKTRILLGFQDSVSVDSLKPYNTIRIAENVDEIAPYAFAGIFDSESTQIKSLYLNEKLKVVGDGAFQWCSGITYVNFNKLESTSCQLTTLGNKSFAYSGIEGSLSFPKSLETIGDQAFQGCWNISKITLYGDRLGWNIKSIGQYAFSYCENLQSIVFSRFTKIPNWLIFHNHIFYKSGNNLMSGEVLIDQAMYFNPIDEWQKSLINFQSLNEDFYKFAPLKELPTNIFELKCHDKDDKELNEITGLVDTFDPEKELEDNFVYHITLPPEVLYISKEAFFNKIPNSKHIEIDFANVQEIGEVAFANCDWLYGDVNLNSCSLVDEGGFSFCDNITSVSVPGFVKLQGMAFGNCYKLSSLAFTSDYTSPVKDGTFDSATFNGCVSLEKIDLSMISIYPYEWEDLIKPIEQKPFTTCSTTCHVIVNKDLKTKDSWNKILKGLGLFSWSDVWKEDIWCKIVNDDEESYTPNRIYRTIKSGSVLTGFIDDHPDLAQYNNIVLPEGINEIKDEAFSGLFHDDSSSLDDIKHISLEIPYGVTHIRDKAFYNNNCLSGQLNLPSSLKEIGDEAFYNCGFFGSIFLPEGITKIGKNAFANNNFSKISFPSTIEQIDSSAFEGNKYLNIIDFSQLPDEPWKNIPGFDKMKFTSKLSHGSIIIPEGANKKEWFNYAKSSEGWQLDLYNEGRVLWPSDSYSPPE